MAVTKSYKRDLHVLTTNDEMQEAILKKMKDLLLQLSKIVVSTPV
jgi:hypothetical protein